MSPEPVAIVTGVGPDNDEIGIGRATALVLAGRGYRVACIDRSLTNAGRTQRMIEERSGRAIAVRADVSDSDACLAAVGDVASKWGRIDVLVNNVAVVGPTGDEVTTDLDAWDPAMRINLGSMVYMARACIPRFVEVGGGSIINVSSIGGLLGGDPALFYGVSKGAVTHMTRVQAALHGRQGIRVNCVAPGVVYTPFARRAGSIDEVLRKARTESTLLGTEGTAWDVANAIAFLAGAEARWITGVILPVDAGYTAGRRANLVNGFTEEPEYRNEKGNE